uniref:PorV/PorQ family protein n=1 Tax=candidate division WOR-3 bacterium TaxID=2052148 RepID=A0A7C6EJ97_UNCW3
MELILSLFLFQAFERYTVSAHNQALSLACVGTAQGIDALRMNPAGLGLLNKNIIGVGYEYTFTHIEGLQNIFFGFAKPLFYGGFGIGISQFGFEEEKEQGITTAYSIGLNKDFYLGGSADLYLIQNKRTGTGISYGLNLGMLGILSKKWYLGIYGHNLNQPQFGNSEIGTIPASLQAGIGYKPFEDITSEIDLSISDQIIRLHSAGEFSIADFLNLRTGFKTNPNSLSAGLGIVYKKIKIDYACEYFVDLPLNHIIAIILEF